MRKVSQVALALLLALVAAACSGGGSSDAGNAGPATFATRPPDSPSTTGGASTNFDNPPGGRGDATRTDRKSQPYWVPVDTFTGTGATTTRVFAIDANGLVQWRVKWHCDQAPFSITPARESGEELRRKLGDALQCPADGEGYGSDAGRYVLKVAAAGAWKIDVERQVDVPLIEAALPAMASAKVLATARMYNVDRTAEGTARLYELPDGSRAIRLEDFFVTQNSDLEVALSPLPEPKSTDEVVQGTFTVVAPLKATVGSMNYAVPPEIDVSKFKSIVIWCEITRNAYGAASLTP